MNKLKKLLISYPKTKISKIDKFFKKECAKICKEISNEL